MEKKWAKIIPFFNNSFFKNVTSKNIAQASLTVQSQSKKNRILR